MALDLKTHTFSHLIYRTAFTCLLFCLPCTMPAYAIQRTINLTVGYQLVNFANKPIQAIAVSQQIPGPILHFKEGDQVTINVHNKLDKGTAIHWHGLLVPWKMDGVEMLTQDPIPPGGVFHYQYTIKQSGTYWYHAHSDLQEQQGLYGPIIIDPIKPPTYQYNKDFVITLSDWSNADPEQIYANLKKSGDYYSIQFPLQASLSAFIHAYQNAHNDQERQELKSTYSMMQKMRMSPYDISDVAYDTFLLNGHPPNNPWRGLVKLGDTVRLRFINAGSSTYFHIKIPNTMMQVVHVQGNDIKPYHTNSLTIAPAETYDVLVKIKTSSPYIIYAESADTLGAAYGALVTHKSQQVNFKTVMPFPTPKPQMNMSMDDMPGMTGHSSMMAVQHTSSMTHAMPDMGSQNITPYQSLIAPYRTNDPSKPVHIIKMELSGYMDRYLWFINGLPEYKAKPILIEPGQRYRLIFINKTMMHHPMHIHGHWFILRNGHGTHDPLLHTIDVPPGKTITVDFDANTDGKWLFHCHNLYHMRAGMARVFRYTSLELDSIETNKPSEKNYHSGNHRISQPDAPIHPKGKYAATTLEIGRDLLRDSYDLSLNALYGTDENKFLLNTDDAEITNGKIENANFDIFYWHLLSEFWAMKGGLNYVYRPSAHPYSQPGIGIEGLMPYFIATDIKAYYHQGSTQLDLQFKRDTQLTHKFFIRTGIRSIWASKTIANDEIGSGLNNIQYIFRPYIQIAPDIALFTEFNHTDYYGTTKHFRQQDAESNHPNALILGAAFLF